MVHYRRPRAALCAALFATVTMAAQDRTAMRITIAGVDLPADTQPRVIVEQQRGAPGEARVEVRGRRGMAYAAAVARGDTIDVAASTLDGPSVPVFTGTVLSLEPGLDGVEPFVLIRASGVVSDDPGVSPTPLTLDAGPGGDVRLLAFAPRLSSSSSLQEVLVTGTDVATGLSVTGRAVAPVVRLDADPGVFVGRSITVDAGRTFASAEEADAFAATLLAALLETRLSAEVVASGSPYLRPGTFVEVKGLDARFEGAYYVSGVSHRIGPDSYGGFSSSLRLRRADFAMFVMPEIDDEVLVGFEHGDLDRPYVLDSWWNCDSQPRTARSDDSDPCRLLRWPW